MLSDSGRARVRRRAGHVRGGVPRRGSARRAARNLKMPGDRAGSSPWSATALRRYDLRVYSARARSCFLSSVATQPLQADPIVGGKGDVGVDVIPVEAGTPRSEGEGKARARWVHRGGGIGSGMGPANVLAVLTPPSMSRRRRCRARTPGTRRWTGPRSCLPARRIGLDPGPCSRRPRSPRTRSGRT